MCTYISSVLILYIASFFSSLHGYWNNHDDVIKWKHFPRYWSFVRGIHRSQVNSPLKGQWRGALVFSLICAWINVWVNNREAGDLRRHCAQLWRHCNVEIKVRVFCFSGCPVTPIPCCTSTFSRQLRTISRPSSTLFHHTSSSVDSTIRTNPNDLSSRTYVFLWIVKHWLRPGKPTLMARFMGPTWGPSGADRTQVGPMLAPWTLLSG